jgi:hypothetical protein
VKHRRPNYKINGGFNTQIRHGRRWGRRRSRCSPISSANAVGADGSEGVGTDAVASGGVTRADGVVGSDGVGSKAVGVDGSDGVGTDVLMASVLKEWEQMAW